MIINISFVKKRTIFLIIQMIINISFVKKKSMM